MSDADDLIRVGRKHEAALRNRSARCNYCGRDGHIARSIDWLRNNLGALLDRLEAADLENMRLRQANASLIPDAMIIATDVGCMRVERDGAWRERDEARAECERLRVECNDSADRDAELYRLRAVVAAIRRGATHDDQPTAEEELQSLVDAVAKVGSFDLSEPTAKRLVFVARTLAEALNEATGEDR